MLTNLPRWVSIVLCSDEQATWVPKTMAVYCNAGVEPIYWIRSNMKPNLNHQGLTQRVIKGFVGYYVSDELIEVHSVNAVCYCYVIFCFLFFFLLFSSRPNQMVVLELLLLLSRQPRLHPLQVLKLLLLHRRNLPGFAANQWMFLPNLRLPILFFLRDKLMSKVSKKTSILRRRRKNQQKKSSRIWPTNSRKQKPSC